MRPIRVGKRALDDLRYRIFQAILDVGVDGNGVPRP